MFSASAFFTSLTAQSLGGARGVPSDIAFSPNVSLPAFDSSAGTGITIYS